MSSNPMQAGILDAGEPTSLCSICKRHLPVSQFYARKGKFRAGTYRSDCKPCGKARYQAYQKTEAFRQRRREQTRNAPRIPGILIAPEQYKALLADQSEPTKRCHRCKLHKPISQFYPCRDKRKYGVISSCKECSRAATRACKKTEEGLRKGRERTRLRSGIVLSEEQYQAMHVAQGGLCSICGLPETRRRNKSDGTFPLSVDHDHTTGRIRGLLCNNCNRGIGCFRENTTFLHKASEYLRLHGK